MNYKKIIKNAIDLHVHIGPEIIPRKFTLAELAEYEKGKIKGIAVKNHFFPAGLMNNQSNKDLMIINSVTLNNYVGGFNAEIIKAVADISNKPIIVWFPTINAENFLRESEFEIPLEWLGEKDKNKIYRKSKNFKGLSIIDDLGKIRKEVVAVLKIIKEKNAILATGHISWKEAQILVKYAMNIIGIRKVIITHPIYQKINMPLEIQKELASLGAFIEQCYSMYSIDKVPIEKIAKQIQYIGANQCILSSDVGQKFSPSPSEALEKFIMLLEKEGIKEKEIVKMTVFNPELLIKK